ncbi:MAG: aminotransferase [Desulfobulbus propionicus]|nr:MAG: aminotransferase [Desulfobulbus propionicus]
MASPISPSNRVCAIAPSATKIMAEQAAKHPNPVSLGQGVPGFTTPHHIIAAVKDALQNKPESCVYTLQNGLFELRQALARQLKKEKGVEIDPETEICITVGAMEGLLDALFAVTDPGDEVLLPSPTYASYTEQVLLANACPVFVPLDNQWQLDFQALEQAITARTKALMLCNPGNPTGNVYGAEQLEQLCCFALANNLVLVLDEAYDYLVYDQTALLNPLSKPAYKKVVISVGSLSKKYCLTGFRVGWVAADQQWMEHIAKVHDATTICAPTPSQYAALAALEGDQQWIADCCREMEQRKELCCRRMDKLSDYFSYVEPQGAFYLMAKYLFSRKASDIIAAKLLAETGVITVPGGSYGAGGEGHLRISFGGSEKLINEAFNRIERWLSTL